MRLSNLLKFVKIRWEWRFSCWLVGRMTQGLPRRPSKINNSLTTSFNLFISGFRPLGLSLLALKMCFKELGGMFGKSGINIWGLYGMVCKLLYIYVG
jgi:hypothetical protein